MIHLLLDTTVYRQDRGRGSAPFRALKRLAQDKQLKIHIPHFVEGEYLSWVAHEIEEKMFTARAALNVLKKLRPSHDDLANIEDLKIRIEELEKNVKESISSDFTDWLSKCECERHDLADSHARRVAASYFEGDAPFKERRSREDIPDAFIWCQIEDLLESYDELHVVTNDKHFHKRLKEVEGVVVYTVLRDFIRSEVAKNLLETAEKHDNLRVFFEVSGQAIPDIKENIRLQVVGALSEEVVEAIGENGEAIIQESDVDSLNLKYYPNEIYYTGDGMLQIPFTGSIHCEVSYPLSKTDFGILRESVTKYMHVEELNEHYLSIDESITISFDGVVVLNIGEEQLSVPAIREEAAKQILVSSPKDIELFIHPYCPRGFSSSFPQERNNWWPYRSLYTITGD